MFIQKIMACILILVLSPVLVLSVLFLLVETPTLSPFFKQQRVGINGQLFVMYKLRTMRPCTESEYKELLKKNEASSVIFKIRKDPRVTPIGFWLRKFSIDEFPQLLNVLKGDMSIVGPRPALIGEVIQYSSLASKRLEVLPGCTGLWQISGRSDVSFEEMVDFDLEYINRKSLIFDFLIIIKTVKVVLTGKGAY